MFPLRGEVALDLRATTDVIDDKLVSTFPTIPDAPVSRFELNLNGGEKGILVAVQNICRRPTGQIADAELDGHEREARRPSGEARPAPSPRRRAGRRCEWARLAGRGAG